MRNGIHPWKVIKKELKLKSQRELLNILSKCYKINKDVKQFLTLSINQDPDSVKSIIEERKEQIRNALWTKNRYGNPAQPKIKDAKRVVTDTKKITDNPAIIIGIMLVFVELGIEYTRQYGDMWQSYYHSLGAVFESLTNCLVRNIKNIEKTNRDDFLERIQIIVDKSRDIGWGLSFDISEVYSEMVRKMSSMEGQKKHHFE